MSRKDARLMWSKVSAGIFDAETVEWLQDVADKVLAADKVADNNDRPGQLVMATGISGRAEARDPIVFVILGLEDTLGTGPKPAAVGRAWLKKFLAFGDISDAAFDKRVNRAIAQVESPETRTKLRAIIGRRSRA